MNKDWDTDKGGRDAWVAWLAEVMEECLRVLKPGGHMLCWAIPRTSHWTAWAIESAGFEIRDRIAHVVGSGFPKNMDVSKAIDKHMFHLWLKENPEEKQALYDAKRAVQEAKKEKDKAKVKELLAVYDELQERLERDAGTFREVVGSNPNLEGRHYDMKGDNYGRAEPQEEEVEAFITRPATPEAQKYEGYGLALKPAVEDWWLARKPLIGSVAENVLEHGTGAINIDDCRISFQGEQSTAAARRKSKPVIKYEQEGSWQVRTSPETYKQTTAGELKGRWASHLILTHHLDCVCKGTKRVKPANGSGKASKGAGDASMFGIGSVQYTDGQTGSDGKEEVQDYICAPQCPIRILGEQSGSSKGHEGGKAGWQSDGYVGGTVKKPVDRTGYEDEGTAARFFLNLEAAPPFIYIPKASRAEKEDGLEERNGKRVNNGRNTPIDTPYQRGETKRTNIHPTVKPIKLMRYLVRLITPPDGVVLDPFTGSGTTGVAALLEGFRFYGTECNADYIEIASERIKAAQQQIEFDQLGSLDKARKLITEKTKKEGKGQTSIFDFIGGDNKG
jgi:site-specific DNA-methyltransferase (adenine-specific)